MKPYALLLMLTVCISALADTDTRTIHNQSTCKLTLIETSLYNNPTHNATHSIPPGSSGELVNTITRNAYAEDAYAIYCPGKETNFIVFMYEGDIQKTYYFYTGVNLEARGSEVILTDKS